MLGNFGVVAENGALQEVINMSHKDQSQEKPATI